MSNVWETRYRLLLERFEELADRLTTEQPIATADLEEQTVRLLAAVVMLLRQHKLNKRGQCRFCAASTAVGDFGSDGRSARYIGVSTSL